MMFLVIAVVGVAVVLRLLLKEGGLVRDDDRSSPKLDDCMLKLLLCGLIGRFIKVPSSSTCTPAVLLR